MVKIAFAFPGASDVYVDNCIAPRAPLNRVGPIPTGQYIISDDSRDNCLPFELLQAGGGIFWQIRA